MDLLDEITCGFFYMPTLCCTQMEQVWYSLEHRRKEYNDVTLMYFRGEFKIPVIMVHETTCGLSFQLTKGGIDDGISF
jgi:hypothetical protein